MREIHSLYRHYENPLKAPPIYAYMAPGVAFIFVVARHPVQSLFLLFVWHHNYNNVKKSISWHLLFNKAFIISIEKCYNFYFFNRFQQLWKWVSVRSVEFCQMGYHQRMLYNWVWSTSTTSSNLVYFKFTFWGLLYDRS